MDSSERSASRPASAAPVVPPPTISVSTLLRQRIHAQGYALRRKIRESARVSGAPLPDDSTRLIPGDGDRQAQDAPARTARGPGVASPRAARRRSRVRVALRDLRGPHLSPLPPPDGQGGDGGGARRADLRARFREPPGGRARHARRARLPLCHGAALAFERNGEPLGSRGAAESEVSVANERLSRPGARGACAARSGAAAGRRDRSGAGGRRGGRARPRGSGPPAPARRAAPARRRGSLPGQAGRASRPTPTACCRPSGGRSSRRMSQSCADCRATLFGLREAALRYRSLPVPEPPGRAGLAHHARARPRWPARAQRRLPSPRRAEVARPPPPWRWGYSRSSASESRSRPRNGTATARSRLARRPGVSAARGPAQRAGAGSRWRPASSPSSREASRPAAHAPPCRAAPGGSHRRASAPNPAVLQASESGPAPAPSRAGRPPPRVPAAPHVSSPDSHAGSA